jgi:hypothetical protein
VRIGAKMAQYCALRAPPDTVPLAEGDTGCQIMNLRRRGGHTTQDPKTPMEYDFTEIRRMS